MQLFQYRMVGIISQFARIFQRLKRLLISFRAGNQFAPKRLVHSIFCERQGWLRDHLNVLYLTLRDGRGNAVLSHAFQVEGDCVPDFRLYLADCSSGCDTSR